MKKHLLLTIPIFKGDYKIAINSMDYIVNKCYANHSATAI